MRSRFFCGFERADSTTSEDSAGSESDGNKGQIEGVRLRSRFGLHPFLEFSIWALVILLSVCIVPSLFFSSRRLYVSSSVYPLRVEIDGQSVGITPCNLKVKPGKHVVEFIYGDEKLKSMTVGVRPAWFLSYVFEYSEKIHADIKLPESVKSKAHKDFLKDCLDYQTLFRADSTHIQKPYFSYYRNLLGDEMNRDYVKAARLFIANSDAGDDYMSSCAKYAEAFDLPDFREGDFNLLIDDSVALSDDAALNVVGERSIGGREFVEFDEFLVAKDLVDTNLFNVFMKENFRFSPSGKQALIKSGLADNDYLSAYGEGGSVRSVSYEVAQEFLKWFGRKYGCKARLLTKPEYVRLYSHKVNFRNLLSGLFELTSTSFITREALDGKRRHEREDICSVFEREGLKMSKELFCLGSYDDGVDDSMRLKLVGVIGPDECFETVGFRIAVDK